jgi:hypothetical protein
MKYEHRYVRAGCEVVEAFKFDSHRIFDVPRWFADVINADLVVYDRGRYFIKPFHEDPFVYFDTHLIRLRDGDYVIRDERGLSGYPCTVCRADEFEVTYFPEEDR